MDESKPADEKKDDSGRGTEPQVETEAEPKEHEEDAQELPEPFYDKTKSFFDHISCEALEQQEGY